MWGGVCGDGGSGAGPGGGAGGHTTHCEEDQSSAPHSCQHQGSSRDAQQLYITILRFMTNILNDH